MTTLRCYRCGESLERLSLPLARLDECPACTVQLHVCRMCSYYLPSAPDGCTEDDAETVTEKARANFCDYFKPSPEAFDGSLLTGEKQAHDELAALFGDDAGGASGGSERGNASASTDADDPLETAANALFRR